MSVTIQAIQILLVGNHALGWVGYPYESTAVQGCMWSPRRHMAARH